MSSREPIEFKPEPTLPIALIGYSNAAARPTQNPPFSRLAKRTSSSHTP